MNEDFWGDLLWGLVVMAGFAAVCVIVLGGLA